MTKPAARRFRIVECYLHAFPLLHSFVTIYFFLLSEFVWSIRLTVASFFWLLLSFVFSIALSFRVLITRRPSERQLRFSNHLLFIVVRPAVCFVNVFCYIQWGNRFIINCVARLKGCYLDQMRMYAGVHSDFFKFVWVQFYFVWLCVMCLNQIQWIFHSVRVFDFLETWISIVCWSHLHSLGLEARPSFHFSEMKPARKTM